MVNWIMVFERDGRERLDYHVHNHAFVFWDYASTSRLEAIRHTIKPTNVHGLEINQIIVTYYVTNTFCFTTRQIIQ
jgi:hypothetical protein